MPPEPAPEPPLEFESEEEEAAGPAVHFEVDTEQLLRLAASRCNEAFDAAVSALNDLSHEAWLGAVVVTLLVALYCAFIVARRTRKSIKTA